MDNSFKHALYIIENCVRYHQCSVCMREAYRILLIPCLRAHQPHARPTKAFCMHGWLGVSEGEGRAYMSHELSATFLHTNMYVCAYIRIKFVFKIMHV